MCKRILLLILCIIFAAMPIYAENKPYAPESSDNPEVSSANTDAYFKHVSGWEEITPEKIRIETTKMTFYLDSDNQNSTLKAQILPLNANDKKLSYSSSNKNIATVDENGNISTLNTPGTAVITVTNGALTEQCEIEVIRGVTGVSLSRSDMLFYADRPVTAQLSAAVSPADATNQNIKWQSEDTSVAAVDENGLVTPCGVGTTKILAITEDGGFKAECIVYVQIYNIPVRGLFITNAIDALRIDGEYSLTSYIYPQNAREHGVTWSSSDSNIVTVDSAGNLKGVSEGMAVITATAKNGVEDYFTISIVPDDGKEFQFNYISKPVEERIAELSRPVTYKNYSYSLDKMVSAQMAQNPTVFTTNASSASRSDVEKYVNPQNFTTGYAKYQFIDLSVFNNVSISMLDTYLSDKGVLKGKGDVFSAAARDAGISEIYLAVHACLESGNGSSELAKGVLYEGVTVYNMFGIGAYDESPINGGAKYAYDNGWTSVDAAIKGGAEWISRNYINSGQNTLYKMRWNPEKPGTHQYATDVAWAIKQAKTIKNMYDAFPDSSLQFEVPVYSGQTEAVIGWE